MFPFFFDSVDEIIDQIFAPFFGLFNLFPESILDFLYDIGSDLYDLSEHIYNAFNELEYQFRGGFKKLRRITDKGLNQLNNNLGNFLD